MWGKPPIVRGKGKRERSGGGKGSQIRKKFRNKHRSERKKARRHNEECKFLFYLLKKESCEKTCKGVMSFSFNVPHQLSFH